MSKITKIIARQIFDSRGNPTIEVEVFSNKISASACLLYTSPSPRDRTRSRMPSSA